MLPLYFDSSLGGHGLYISLFFFNLCGRQAIVKVVTVYQDADEVDYAMPGENLRIRLSGVEEEDISPGFVLSSARDPIPTVLEFDAQLQILELLDHKAIFTAGYKAVLHIHAIVEECEIVGLLHQINPKTKKPIRKKILFVKSGAVVVVRIQVRIVMINNGSG
jgi:peptide chain release factor subunit 3